MGHFTKKKGRRKKGNLVVGDESRRYPLNAVYAGKGYYDQPVYRAKGGTAPEGRKPKGFFLGGLFSGTPGKSTSYQTSNTNVNYDPTYTALLQKTLGRASEVMDTPYEAYGGDRNADFTADQTNAFQGVRNMQGSWSPYTGQASDSLGRASGMDPNASAQPWLDKAAGTSTATNAAQPFMNSAAETLPQGLNAYMSPYTDSVVNRIGDLGARNLTEKLLPGVNDVFTGSQFGRDRHAEFTARALRDTNESVLGQQAQALESGYKTAADAFASDKNRAAGLAGQAGQLASTDMSNAGSLAATSAGITGAAKAGDVALGNAQAGLGQTVQGAQARDATALATSGGMQQQQAQKDADFAYQQFGEKKAYPMQMLDWAKGVGTGWQLPSSTNSTSFGQTTQQAPQGSPFGQIVGGLTSLAGAVGTGGLSSLAGGLGSMFGGGGQQYGPPSPFAHGGRARGHFAAGGHAPVVRGIRDGVMQRQQMAGPPQGEMPMPQRPMPQQPPMPPMQMRARGGHFGKRNYADGGEVQHPRGGYFLNSLPPGYGGRPDIDAIARRGWEDRRPRAPGEPEAPNGGPPIQRPRAYDPLSMLIGAYPRATRDSFKELLLDLSPPAVIRDGVRGSGELGRGMIEGNAGRMMDGVSDMGFAALGLIPGAGLVPRLARRMGR